ncbi:hypothetical protein ACFLT2_03505 [Acidobacteriota bacterium]
MPKRYQITLPFWLCDFLDELTEKSGTNPSEMSRILMCIGVITACQARWPDECHPSFEGQPPEYYVNNFELADKEGRQRFWSQHEFEAQKALEYYRGHIEELIAKVKKSLPQES